MKLEEMDIWSGRREVSVGDEEAAVKKKTVFHKIRNVVVG